MQRTIKWFGDSERLFISDTTEFCESCNAQPPYTLMYSDGNTHWCRSCLNVIFNQGSTNISDFDYTNIDYLVNQVGELYMNYKRDLEDKLEELFSTEARPNSITLYRNNLKQEAHKLGIEDLDLIHFNINEGVKNSMDVIYFMDEKADLLKIIKNRTGLQQIISLCAK